MVNGAIMFSKGSLSISFLIFFFSTSLTFASICVVVLCFKNNDTISVEVWVLSTCMMAWAMFVIRSGAFFRWAQKKIKMGYVKKKKKKLSICETS